MKRAVSLGVFVVAVLAIQMASYAQDQASSYAAGQPQTGQIFQIPQANSLAKFAAKRTGDAKIPDGAFNGFVQHRLLPDLGAAGSSGNGFHHFSMPFDKYTNWYRPRAATLTQYQRCAPDEFRPKGFGHLFARPYDGYRMEYEPYSLSDGMSLYGPSYITRMPDPRCDDHCSHCSDDACENDCDKCRR